MVMWEIGFEIPGAFTAFSRTLPEKIVCQTQFKRDAQLDVGVQFQTMV